MPGERSGGRETPGMARRYRSDHRMLLRVNRLTMASRITAPISENRNVRRVMASLMPPPNRKPAISAPTMPTTTLRMMPCWASRRMMMLASQPTMPPTISQMMMPMNVTSGSGRDGDQLTRSAVKPSCNPVTGACG